MLVPFVPQCPFFHTISQTHMILYIYENLKPTNERKNVFFFMVERILLSVYTGFALSDSVGETFGGRVLLLGDERHSPA